MPFPDDAPNHKYAALFDGRSCFDSLRWAFLVRADPCSRLERFTETLRHILGELDAAFLTESIMDPVECFMKAAQQFGDVHGIRELDDFARRAWPSYLKTVAKKKILFQHRRAYPDGRPHRDASARLQRGNEWCPGVEMK